MLHITVPERELWDDAAEKFIHTKEQHLTLEHSLVSISKWEAKWCKPFISKEQKTAEEALDYIRCMTLTQNVNPDVYRFLTPQNYKEINDYIDAPMTATTIHERDNGRHSREIITSELIYYWMIAFNIPVEFQKWHLNRLLTLIRVCGIKNGPQKKLKGRELARSNAALNAARRKKYNTKG